MVEEHPFKHCCELENKINYQIIHDPQPIELSVEMRESIDRLLWYVPGIEHSVQSPDNPLLDHELYSEIVFEIIMDIMDIVPEQDVKIVEGQDKIDEYDSKFYKESICPTCQKLIFTKRKSKTIVVEILRHIRNAVAHGNFTIKDRLLILFDQKKNQEPTAFMKIDISSLNKLLKIIVDENGITKEKIMARVFENAGYKIKYKNQDSNMMIDIEGKTYVLDILDVKRKKKVGYNDSLIKKIMDLNLDYLRQNIIPIFIVDQGTITDKAKFRFMKEAINVLDKKDIESVIKNKFILL